MTRSFDAMLFARGAHADQSHPFSETRYVDYLARVAGIVAAVGDDFMVAVAWLHGAVARCGISQHRLAEEFGPQITRGVMVLTDDPTIYGSVAVEPPLTALCMRLGATSGWIQTIRAAIILADLTELELSHRPESFVQQELRRNVQLLNSLNRADSRLMKIVRPELEKSLCG